MKDTYVYGSIFKMTKKNRDRNDYYILCPSGPEHFMLINLSYGSKLADLWPHNRKDITLGMIQASAHYFVKNGYRLIPVNNVELSYEIIVPVPSPISETAKLRGGSYK